MKKFILIFSLLIFGVFSLMGQTTTNGIRNSFKESGLFYITVDNDFENHSVLMFKAIKEESIDADGNIVSAVWETVETMEHLKRGEKWFKEQMATEAGQLAMWKIFYNEFRIIIGEDLTITEDGRARITMTIMRV